MLCFQRLVLDTRISTCFFVAISMRLTHIMTILIKHYCIMIILYTHPICIAIHILTSLITPVTYTSLEVKSFKGWTLSFLAALIIFSFSFYNNNCHDNGKNSISVLYGLYQLFNSIIRFYHI